jgi:ubiquinone biosynthesis protein
VRLTIGVRILDDPSDRRYLTGLIHRVLLAFLAAAAGIMAVLMIGIHGGPALSKTVSLYSFFGYCLLVIAATPRAFRPALLSSRRRRP